MSKINPEPNLIHIMGCYVLGNPNGEKVRVLRFWVWIPGLLAELGLVLTGLCLCSCSCLDEQLFQKLKNLMRPYSVEFESPLELSAQGGD